jgi:hypothetical protein
MASPREAAARFDPAIPMSGDRAESLHSGMSRVRDYYRPATLIINIFT